QGRALRHHAPRRRAAHRRARRVRRAARRRIVGALAARGGRVSRARVLALVVAGALGAGCQQGAACYHAPAGERGWKEVKLPRAAPHLAAPDGLDQYRPGEPYVVWKEHAPQWPAPDGLGATDYWFLLERGQVAIEIDFAARLGGAQVDVVGEREDGSEYA